MDEVTQVLFGMDGFRVLAAVADPLDGELGVLVETIDRARGCPDCGVVGQVKHRSTAMPAVTAGGKRSGFEKSRSRVTSARPAPTAASRTVRSSAPQRPSS